MNGKRLQHDRLRGQERSGGRCVGKSMGRAIDGPCDRWRSDFVSPRAEGVYASIDCGPAPANMQGDHISVNLWTSRILVRRWL